MAKKYCVTGATGFIGGEVVRQLIAAGHEVIAVVRTPEKARSLADLGVDLRQGDITDKDSLRGPMTGVDGVFHLAAVYKIGRVDHKAMWHINVDGTRHVLELMREMDIPKGVYTSTVAVFSDTKGQLVDEAYRSDGPFISQYERTKWAAHYTVAEPMMRAGLPLVIVMPGAVYGPGDTSIIQQHLNEYLKGHAYLVPRGIRLCWAHVEDVARGHLLAMERGTPGESYIIAGPVHDYREALAINRDLTGIHRPLTWMPVPLVRLMAQAMRVIERVVPVPEFYTAEGLRTWAGVTYIGSSEKAEKALGFSARPFEEGWRAHVLHTMQQAGRAPHA